MDDEVDDDADDDDADDGDMENSSDCGVVAIVDCTELSPTF